MKKTILYVHHSGNLGGAPISLSYIIKELDRKKYEPILVNIARGPINDFFQKLKIKFHFLPSARPFHGSTVVEKNWRLFLKNWIYLIPSIFVAYRYLKRIKPDLIHLNSTCLFSFAVAARFLQKEIPVICHIREPLRKGLWGWPLRKFCKHFVDGFIAISKNDLLSMSLKKHTKHQAEVIYNFYEKPTAAPPLAEHPFRKELNIPSTAIIFLYLARFASSNGWENLIQYAKKLDLKKNDYHLVLVGAVEDYPEYEKINNVHILKFREDVPGILKESDIFVCPFVEPHFARGIIEASSYGLPVIGNRIGGVDELVLHEKTGFLYKTEDEFRDYAQKLADDEELRSSMGQEGKIFAEENFNMKKNLQKTYNFYNRYF